jgi:aldehyde:ferredoxin oxidoreductase
MNLRNGRAVILDLDSKEAVEQELPDVHDWEALSAIKIADDLTSEHGGDCLVLGTGALTGSFVPASCCGIVRCGGQQPRTAPILGHAGVELKMSGFDFVVLKEKARTPGYLWVRDGVAEFSEAKDMHSLSSWARTDRIRADQGDSKIQVVAAGPWGDAGLASSQLVTDYWGGEDKVGMSAEFGRRGVLAVAFRGMGELELAEPEGHFEEALLLMREQIERLGENRGLASYYLGAARDDFARLTHRHVACYGCPFPCRTFLKTSEDPGELRLVSREPGYLHYDIASLETAFRLGADAKTASEILVACAKAGAEPVSVLSEIERAGKTCTPEEVERIVGALGEVHTVAPANFERSFTNRGDYETCLGLGLCPRYWSKAGFDLSSIAPFAESAFGWPKA